MVSQQHDPLVSALSKFWGSLNSNGWATPMDFRKRQSPGEELILEAPKKDPYQRSYDEIFSIQQSGSQGLRVIDIDPNNATREEFACQVDPSTIIDIVGPDNSLGLSGAGFSIESPVLANWRTIEIPLAATFVKFEYLPSRANPYLSNSTLPNNFGKYTAVNTSNQYAEENLLQNILLLQFDSSTTRPIIAKHGDCFRLPFNSIFLTFKVGLASVGMPRIRITAGYNAEIRAQDDRSLFAHPAFGSGHGLANNPFYHATPFSIASRDPGSGSAGTVVPYVSTTVGTPTYTKELIVNDSTVPGMRPGGMIGWITSINWACYTPNGAVGNPPVRVDLELGIGNLAFTTQLRRLYYSPGIVLTNNVATDQKIFNQQQVTLAHPLRFSLKEMECLVLRLRSESIDVYHTFGISGYSMNNLSPSIVGGTSAGNAIPMYPCWTLTENPYPLD